MILVVCYAVHDKEIVDIRKFNDYKKAHAFIEEDSRNTYNEEIENGDEDAIYKLEEERHILHLMIKNMNGHGKLFICNKYKMERRILWKNEL